MAEPDHRPGCPADPADDSSWKIGIEVRGVYDGVLIWKCGLCGAYWHRWPEGTPNYERARPYSRDG